MCGSSVVKGHLLITDNNFMLESFVVMPAREHAIQRFRTTPVLGPEFEAIGCPKQQAVGAPVAFIDLDQAVALSHMMQ